MTSKNSVSHPSSGNVLFLILIAVVLFASLSYAVSNTNTNSAGNVSAEKAELASSQIVQYSAMLQNAILRIKTLNNCTDFQISFWHNSNGDGSEDGGDDFYNNKSPNDHSCHVFDKNGGGAVYMTPPALAQNEGNYIFTPYAINGFGTDGDFFG